MRGDMAVMEEAVGEVCLPSPWKLQSMGTGWGLGGRLDSPPQAPCSSQLTGSTLGH